MGVPSVGNDHCATVWLVWPDGAIFYHSANFLAIFERGSKIFISLVKTSLAIFGWLKTSLTRRLYYFFNICPVVTMKMSPKALQKFQGRFNILPNIKLTRKHLPKVFKIAATLAKFHQIWSHLLFKLKLLVTAATVRLPSCLFCLDSAALHMLIEQQF